MQLRRITAFFALLFLFGSQTVTAQTFQIAKGVVYNDKNANGKRDKGEPGIAGVPVSNGREIVRTAQDGTYQLPVSDDATLFVIKPDGYKLPVNNRNLPQFFYTHKPAGSDPNLKYKGIAPTGALPASVDFALLESTSSSDFKVLLFSDTQVYNDAQVDYLRRGVVDSFTGKTSEYLFGITMGDVVGDTLPLYEPLIDVMKNLETPWFHVLGNHDMNFDVRQNEDHDETFTRVFGPATYAFQEGQTHFIIVDDVLYPRPDGRNGYVGGLTDQNLDFIENYLAWVPQEELVVLAMHIPLYFENNTETFRREDRDRLFRILKDHPHTLSISGHTHYQLHYFFDETEGWLQEKPHHHYNMGTASGDWYNGSFDENGLPDATMRDGTPQGAAVLNISGNSYTIDYLPSRDHNRKFTLTYPNVIGNRNGKIPEFYANFYLGSEKCILEFRIDNGNWSRMSRTVREDPTMLSIRQQWLDAETLHTGNFPSTLVNNTHLWRGRFPAGLTPGSHTVEVRATDMFGRQFSEKATFTVLSN